MAVRRPAFNPFYGVVVAAGVAFVVTAFAYGIVAVRAMRPDVIFASVASVDEGPLGFIDRNAFRLFGWELGILALATFLAMTSDPFWTRRAATRRALDKTRSGLAVQATGASDAETHDARLDDPAESVLAFRGEDVSPSGPASPPSMSA